MEMNLKGKSSFRYLDAIINENLSWKDQIGIIQTSRETAGHSTMHQTLADRAS